MGKLLSKLPYNRSAPDTDVAGIVRELTAARAR